MACAAPFSTEADAGSTDGGPPGPAPSAEAQAWLDLHNAVRRNAQPPPSPPLPALTWSSGAVVAVTLLVQSRPVKGVPLWVRLTALTPAIERT